jgi:hypothetical protein
VYPYEGGKYTLDSSNGVLLEADIHKNIHSQEPGSFSLTLAPGGPQGVNSVKTWTEIFTPMSLVVIGGARYVNNGILMVGVVNQITETQSWKAGREAGRTITVTGSDFQYYFAMFSYYTLYFLGSTVASALSDAAGIGAAALPSLNGKGLLGAAQPSVVGAAWFNDIMAGKNGILNNTKFYYGKEQVNFNAVMSQAYDSYPAPVGIVIPMAENFLSSQGTWYEKFSAIFPMPFYEFFVITAPVQLYDVNASFSVNADTFIKMPAVTKTSFSPTLVARINPVPQAVNTNGTWSMDVSRWNKLTLYNMVGHSFIESSVRFDESEVRNLYIIQPVTMLTMFGQSASNISPFVFTFQGLVDIASVHRYGYRPQITETYWLADFEGKGAQTNGLAAEPFSQFVSEMLLRVSSWYEPLPLMASGEMTTIFRPDIIPGNRFTYAPFKNGELWTFYIEAITHNYEFGDETTTTLSLTRGLPSAIYEQKGQNDLLLAIHVGDAMRKDGAYTTGLPANIGSGLTELNPQSSFAIQGEMAKVFVTPGAK